MWSAILSGCVSFATLRYAFRICAGVADRGMRRIAYNDWDAADDAGEARPMALKLKIAVQISGELRVIETENGEETFIFK